MVRLRLILSLVLSGIVAPAMANIGVTSATDGDPLGHPPAQQERILRVGTDIQVNERISTKENDRAHIVFLDSTAITIGPNSSLVIDRFVYDPGKSTGTLSITAAKGVMRIVGGALTKTGDVTVSTPSSSLGVRGGIAIIEVSPTGATTATFLFGESLTVTSHGKTQVATRAGSLIHVEPGRPPSLPTIVPTRGLSSNATLESLSGSSTPAAAPAKPISGAVEAALDRSQFSAGNSKVAPRVHDQHLAAHLPQASVRRAPIASATPHVIAAVRLNTIAQRAVTQHHVNSAPKK